MTDTTREVFKRIGDVELAIDIYRPAGWAATDRRPGILFFFGGGWVGGKMEQFKPHCEHYAGLGMVALAAEYRVKTRHGTTPFECVDDARSAVAWTATQAGRLGIDPARIVLGGGSAGGHVAASTAVRGGYPARDAMPAGVPCALILFNPVLDTTETGFGSKALGDRQLELSCAHHVVPGLPPTLIFHGTADTTVPFANAEAFCRNMTEAGNRCELVPFPGEKHGFFNFGKGNGAYEKMLEFADKFIESLGIELRRG
jgi:acetyl esterase/lipase